MDFDTDKNEMSDTPIASADEEKRKSIAAKRTFFFSLALLLIVLGLLTWVIVEHIVLQ